MHLDTRRKRMAGKSDIVTGALEGIIDSFTAAKQLFASPKQEGDMVKTLREGDASEGQTGVVSRISGDGTVVTVDFPDTGMQYKYFAEDVVPSTGVAEIDMKIEDFYFGAAPEPSLPKVTEPVVEKQITKDELFIPPHLLGIGRKE
jgi:hypothetical protein